jgi:glucosamine--fructose-6-phosphate aminotransferase (isomerizing)
MAETAQAPGAHALAEILSQPRCWDDCFQALGKDDSLEQIRKLFAPHSDALLIGCGSSYYVALAAAASWTALTGSRARAVPASDLLLFPKLILSDSSRTQPVLISRSGQSTEVLEAAEYLEKKRNIRTLAISCAAQQPLEKISTLTLHLLPAHETSTVMTRSFTSMLLGLQFLAATLSRQSAFLESLRKLPTSVQTALDGLQGRVQQFVQANEFADYVFLGQGPFYGLACESMLKVKEMSCSYAQCFHTLEFRHGPRAIVSPEALVGFLLSETGFDAEREVLEEVKELGGTTLVVTNRADDRTRRAADFLVELQLGAPEYARLAPYVFAGQFLGLCTGLKKGLDPDRPRHLSRVVILQEKN